jgi:hypothetical protein
LNNKLVPEDELISVEPISGGVSCFVWKITVGNLSWVIKQARIKLDVQADWYADAERIHKEHKAMTCLRDLMPQVRFRKFCIRTTATMFTSWSILKTQKPGRI